MTLRTQAGTALAPVPPELQDRPVLTVAEVAQLTDLGRRVAAHFRSPQDIEWALATGRLYLVQSRPITSLFPVPRPPPADAGLPVYMGVNILRGLVEPITPMGISLFRCVVNGVGAFTDGLKVPPGQPAPAFKVAAGRMFFDITVPLRHPRARAAFPKLLSIIDPQVSAIVQALLQREPRLRPWNKRLPLRLPLGFALGVVGRLLRTVCAPEAGRVRQLAT